MRTLVARPLWTSDFSFGRWMCLYHFEIHCHHPSRDILHRFMIIQLYSVDVAHKHCAPGMYINRSYVNPCIHVNVYIYTIFLTIYIQGDLELFLYIFVCRAFDETNHRKDFCWPMYSLISLFYDVPRLWGAQETAAIAKSWQALAKRFVMAVAKSWSKVRAIFGAVKACHPG